MSASGEVVGGRRLDRMPSEDLPSGSPFPRSTAKIAGHPLHPLLVPVPIACFVGTLLTDIVYWRTANMLWADMSAWLLSAGLLVSVLAVIAGMVDFFGDRRIRALHTAWAHGLGNGVALLLEIVNAFVHSRDAYSSVVPTGLVLSAVSVAILGVTAWFGGELVYRHGVGVRTGAEMGR
jgi:uncharacterized membrane protein